MDEVGAHKAVPQEQRRDGGSSDASGHIPVDGVGRLGGKGLEARQHDVLVLCWAHAYVVGWTRLFHASCQNRTQQPGNARSAVVL